MGLELTARTATQFRNELLFLDHFEDQVDQLTHVLENITKAKGLNTWWALIGKSRLCEVVYRISMESSESHTPHRIDVLEA